jgi:carbon-monoxide dehydrogenase large subunit
MRNSYIGSPVERREDWRFLRGRGQYVDDLPSHGALHAAILRSPIAHGRVRSIDTSAAKQRPGVRAVITAADIGGVPVITMRQELLPAFTPYQQPVIAGEKVRYVGEPLAVVIAETAAWPKTHWKPLRSTSSPCCRLPIETPRAATPACCSRSPAPIG